MEEPYLPLPGLPGNLLSGITSVSSFGTSNIPPAGEARESIQLDVQPIVPEETNIYPDIKIHPSWKEVLKEEFCKEYFMHLRKFVREAYQRTIVYPPKKFIFRAFDSTPFDEVKVVILGQDPYHGEGQANGLCFSVNPGVPIPPSLQNIFQEIRNEFGGKIPNHGDLGYLARQGVLLLNATLTVEAGKPASHQGKGWEEFTDKVVEILSQRKENLVFLLWGSFARKKGEVIDKNRHLVLESAHPSPLSAQRGFLGNGHFAKANDYLRKHGKDPIQWLPPEQAIGA